MQLLQKTGELETGGLYSSYVLFEYFPLTKINSVPPSATAARRDLLPNALVVLKWSGDFPDKSDEANAIVEDLVGILKGGKPDLQNGMSPKLQTGDLEFMLLRLQMRACTHHSGTPIATQPRPLAQTTSGFGR